MVLSHGMLKDLKTLRLNLTPGEKGSGNPVMAGILARLANPYWSVHWY